MSIFTLLPVVKTEDERLMYVFPYILHRLGLSMCRSSPTETASFARILASLKMWFIFIYISNIPSISVTVANVP